MKHSRRLCNTQRARTRGGNRNRGHSTEPAKGAEYGVVANACGARLQPTRGVTRCRQLGAGPWTRHVPLWRRPPALRSAGFGARPLKLDSWAAAIDHARQHRDRK
jgi:hypothetical protein